MLKLLICLCALELTFYRFRVGISVGEVGGDAQGAAVGAGPDAGGLEQQRFPGGAVSQSHHLPWASTPLAARQHRLHALTRMERYVSMHLGSLICLSLLSHTAKKPCFSLQ